MITIEHGSGDGGYHITLREPGTGTRARKAYARSIHEVHEAIDHYFGLCSRTTKAHAEGCPLCRKNTQ